MERVRDYGSYASETTVIQAFEDWEEDLDTDLGGYEDDFMDWFICFRAGFIAGGDS